MPTSIRLFVSSDLAAEAIVELAPGQAHYLKRRHAEIGGRRGAAVQRGATANGPRASNLCARTRARLAVATLARPQEAEPDLWLVAAVLKTAATELVVQKATELGVSRSCSR